MDMMNYKTLINYYLSPKKTVTVVLSRYFFWKLNEIISQKNKFFSLGFP